MWASGWVETLLKNTHIYTCVFCSCVNTWNYSITLLRPEHTLTHKAKDIQVLRRMEKAAASTEVLSHLHDRVHKCSTLTFFTTLTPTWQKIFCCAKSEMGTKPSGGHISVTESRLHYFVIVHSGLSLSLSVFFLFFFRNSHTDKQFAFVWGKWGFYSCGSSATWCVRSHWLHKLAGRVRSIVCCIL